MNNSFKLFLFCAGIAFCLHSCAKSFEPVVITEELLCEIQETFEGVMFRPYARPCEIYVEIKTASFRDFKSMGNTSLVVNMEGRYNFKLHEEQEDKKVESVVFERYLNEMERLGIKCIYVTDVIPNDTSLIREPCNKITHIHFYADRISLAAIPALENINLENYESVYFGMIPIHIIDSVYTSTVFPGTTWAYNLYGNANRENNSNEDE